MKPGLKAALSHVALSALLVAAYLPLCSHGAGTAETRGNFVTNAIRGAPRTAVTKDCIRTAMPKAGLGVAECQPLAPVAAKATAPPAKPPATAAAAPTAPVAAKPAPPAVAETTAPPAPTVADFVGKPEPHDKVPAPPMKPLAYDDDRRQYDEEQGKEAEEGIVAQYQYYEEDGVEGDDGILAHNRYYEEDGVEGDDGIVARNQYYEEEGIEVADNIGGPKAFAEEQVAAAEEKKPEARPAPKPETKPAPKPVVLPVTVTVEADALFDFDRYIIRSDAHAKLDKLVNDLPGVKSDQILVVGHADRIGAENYNRRLSQRRAKSVKTYLVGKGVPAGKIKTEGRGELEPETTPGQCKGLRKAKLIACLQPDRRVEVTVTGQK